MFGNVDGMTVKSIGLEECPCGCSTLTFVVKHDGQISDRVPLTLEELNYIVIEVEEFIAKNAPEQICEECAEEGVGPQKPGEQEEYWNLLADNCKRGKSHREVQVGSIPDGLEFLQSEGGGVIWDIDRRVVVSHTGEIGWRTWARSKGLPLTW